MPFSGKYKRIKHKVCFNTLFYRTIKMSKQTNGNEWKTHTRKSWNPSHFHKICSNMLVVVSSSSFILFHSPFSLARSNGLRKKERERERSGPMSILTIISDWLSAIVNVCAFRCEGQMHTFLKISPSAAICTIPLALNILFFFWVVGMCCTLSFHRYTWIFSDIWNNINNGTRYVLIPWHTEERYMLLYLFDA